LRFEDTLSVGVPYGAPQQMTGVTAPGRAYATEWPTETLAPVALVQPFIDGTANMFVVGYFRYEDVFKIAHETAFAYRLVFDDGADSSKHFDAINNAAYWRYT